VIYSKHCQIGVTLNLDDFAEMEVGEWKMLQFRAACAYAASQGGSVRFGANATNSETYLRAPSPARLIVTA
jgi:hypothetical protein